MRALDADMKAVMVYRADSCAATEIEQKEFMRAFIERIDLYPEKQKDGNWIRNMVFNFPVPVNGQEVAELPLESGTMLECVVKLTHTK